MAVSPRLIKRRLASIKSTRKIMKAMELVAASKMRKAVQQAVNARPFAQGMEDLLRAARQSSLTVKHRWLEPLEKNVQPSVLLVIAASDRGLCGSFNTQVAKKVAELLKHYPNVRAIAIGRRAEQTARRLNIPIVASFPAISNAASFERTHPIAKLIKEEFESGRSQIVELIYTKYQSALVQIASSRSLLPMAIDGLIDQPDDHKAKPDPVTDDMIFEPNAADVVNRLLPRVLEIRLYQSLLESAASEHAARMIAMRNASDSAKDVQSSLTLVLNQARQAAITREISEIAAGKAAIE